MVPGRTIGLLAVLAIAGVTASVAVLVTTAISPAEEPIASGRVPAPAVRPRARPRLSSTTDVRTFALHRAHLAAASRVECASCHDLRAAEFAAPPVATCLGCHTGHEPAVHRGAPEGACLTCHDFLLAGDAMASARDCRGCHDRDRDGRKHTELASHTTKDCEVCHPAHPRREAAKPVECLGCHDTQATAHPAGGPGRAACVACHLPHRPAREALAGCESCHVKGARDLTAAARIPATALFAGGHDRCVACHSGHTFTRATVKPCRTCHSEKPVLAAEKVPAHAVCASCHDPHAAKSPAVARCTTCHSTIAASSKHPHDARGRDCVGCHPPHGVLGSARPALACNEQCHAEKRDAAHGTTACTDCHVRHRFVPAQTGAALCLSCHAQGTGRTKAIATSAGHAGCTNCHLTGAHRPAAPRPACASCHRGEASTAPPGHATCTNCHVTHTGALRPIAERCEGCHADRAATRHMAVPGGCRGCHRPHGPGGVATRPACTQCHVVTELPGLHYFNAHRDCAACHRAHQTAVSGREPCVRCHTDRRAHYPEARLCQACHLFDGGRR